MAVAAIVASGLKGAAYSAKGVTLYAVLVVLEAAVLLGLLRPKSYRPSWGKALAANGACVAAPILSAQDTSSAPEYMFTHQKWLVAATVATVALAIGSFITGRRKHHSA